MELPVLWHSRPPEAMFFLLIRENTNRNALYKAVKSTHFSWYKKNVSIATFNC